MFSAILSTGGESVVVRLIKNGKKELIFESDCANHGRHRYNLQGKDARGKAGVLYDSLFLRWKGILTG